MAKVCHVSSAHDSRDIRIFVKECCSLASAGYEVVLVAYGDDELVDGVRIAGLGERPSSRVQRMLRGAKKAYKKAESLKADVYHLHDPELLPYAKRLKRSGARVIFDSHEDVPVQILGKTWIPRGVRRIIASIYKKYETSVVRSIDAVVCATPYIGGGFGGRARVVAVVNNFPKLKDIAFQTKPFIERQPLVCYVGGISEARGERVMVEAAKGIHGGLVLAGKRQGSMRECGGNCTHLGVVGRDGVNRVYSESVAGLVILMPLENYIVSRPIKMFEYMAAGLPVVASDFPEWRQIIEENDCGICVDPNDILAVQDAINQLLDNRELAEAMGRRGRMAVEARYNWDSEQFVLINLYNDLLG